MTAIILEGFLVLAGIVGAIVVISLGIGFAFTMALIIKGIIEDRRYERRKQEDQGID